MAILGQERREEVKDNLEGQANIKPVALQVGGISAPRAPRVPTGAAEGLVNALGGFASSTLKSTVNARKERAKLDGQTAYVQGRSLDELTAQGGDKNAREGYKVIDASTTSSALVAAQLVKIEQDGSVTPEQWRASYGAMVEDTVRGKDPRTATLIRDNFASKLGQLVARQTVAHEKWIEQKTFDSVVQSMDIISQDAEGVEVLKNITGFGENSAGAFLSENRKKAAIARGIQTAFLNGNPVAYGILRTAGVLNELTNEQRVSVEASRQTWQNKLRSEGNADMVADLAHIVDLATKGKLDYNPAVRQYAAVLAQNGIDMKAVEQKLLYGAVAHADDLQSSIRAIDLDNALSAGDFVVAGDITADLMQQTETRNRHVDGVMITHGANKGTKAQGITQIMPLTSADPGYGVRPARNKSPEELQRTGRDYWKAMYAGNTNPVGNLPWEAGDWFSAGVAYNWGPKRAKAWFKAGADPAKLPQETKEWLGRYKGYLADMKNPTLAGKLNAATHLQAQNKVRGEAVALDEYFQRVKPVEDVLRQTGDIDFFREQMEFERKRLGIEMSKGIVSDQNQRQDGIMAEIATIAGKENAAQAQAVYKELSHDPLERWSRVANNPNSSPSERIRADWTLKQELVEAMDAAGIQSVATELGKAQDKLNENVLRMQEPLRKRRQELMEQEHAENTGNLGHLNDKGKEETIASAEDKLENGLHELASRTPDATEDSMRDLGSTEYAKLYNKFQFVPEDKREAYSAAIARGLTNEDGSINKSALEAISTYAKIKDLDRSAGGDVAKQFLNEGERIVADAVLMLAGPSGPLEEAMVSYSKQLRPATQGDIDAVVKAEGFEKEVRDEIQSRTNDEVSNGFGGWLHKIWSDRKDFFDTAFTGDEADSLADPSEKDLLVEEVTQEATRLVTKHPRNKAQWVIDTAVANVAERSAPIGRNHVIMKEPILQQFFGDKARNYDQDGIAHMVVVNYLKHLSTQVDDNGELLHPGITEFGGTEFTSLGVGSLFSMLPGVEWNDGLSRQEALDGSARGMRPFYSMVDGERQSLYVEIIGRDGTAGASIQIDMPVAGQLWMDMETPRWTQAGQDAEDAATLDFGIIDSP